MKVVSSADSAMALVAPSMHLRNPSTGATTVSMKEMEGVDSVSFRNSAHHDAPV